MKEWLRELEVLDIYTVKNSLSIETILAELREDRFD